MGPRCLVAYMVVVLLAATASAATITSGSTIANVDSWGYTTFVSFDGGATNELFEMYAFIANSNDGIPITSGSNNFDETIPISGSASQKTSRVTLSTQGASTLGLSAGDISLDFVFEAQSGAVGRYRWQASVWNLSGDDLGDLFLYVYANMDLNGTAAGDFAVGGLSGMTLSDGAKIVSWTPSPAADYFDVGTSPGVLNVLTSGSYPQNLDNTVLPYGPGDFEAAYQFNLGHILSGTSKTVTLEMAMDIPEPSTLGLVLPAVLLGLFALRCRRRV